MNEPDVKRQCYFCEEPCGEDDFCFGCGAYICQQCDMVLMDGPHEPEDHKT